MKERKIKNMITEKVDEIEKLSAGINRDFNREAIHNFRTRVKSLRAFLRLLRTFNEEPKLKLTKKFKRLYQIAGAIRDTQLEMEKLAETHIQLPEYMATLMHKLAKSKKEWQNAYSERTMQQMKKRLLSFNCKELPAEELKRFYESRMDNIRRLKEFKSPTDEQVHTVRKQVKDILYTSKIAKKKWKVAFENARKLPVKKLNLIADAIGDYNDARLSLEHLGAYTSPTVARQEIKNLESLRDEEATRLMEEKKEITGIIAHLLK